MARLDLFNDTVDIARFVIAPMSDGCDHHANFLWRGAVERVSACVDEVDTEWVGFALVIVEVEAVEGLGNLIHPI